LHEFLAARVVNLEHSDGLFTKGDNIRVSFNLLDSFNGVFVIDSLPFDLSVFHFFDTHVGGKRSLINGNVTVLGGR
jgi:hypothetical protein